LLDIYFITAKPVNMKWYQILSAMAFVFAILITGSAFTPKPGYTQGRWEKLGERKVNFKADRDEIHVGVADGKFDALKLKVTEGAINLQRMVVHFGNGDTKEIEMRSNIARGGESRVIDLPGNNRIITKVVFWYDTKNHANRKAHVALWGKH
jgi:hypothetical protein